MDRKRGGKELRYYVWSCSEDINGKKKIINRSYKKEENAGGNKNRKSDHEK